MTNPHSRPETKKKSSLSNHSLFSTRAFAKLSLESRFPNIPVIPNIPEHLASGKLAVTKFKCIPHRQAGEDFRLQRLNSANLESKQLLL